MRRTDALIVGGGPAGSAAAIALARGGATPLLIERHTEPHDALCGGFLSWRTLDALKRLGLDIDALGGAPITHVAIVAGARRARVQLPRPGRGLSRRALDSALLVRAEQEGAQVERGMAARTAEGHGIRLADDSEIKADALFLATGKHELRGLTRPKPGQTDASMGLRFRFAASDALRTALAGTIELHPFRGGYAGLLLQEDGSANLAMALRRSRLGEAANEPERLLAAVLAEAPRLADRIGGETRAGEPDAIGLVPYGWRARDTAPGVFRLGDQAGVIDSLAGEGVGLALASGTSAARHFLEGGADAAREYQARFAHRARRPIAIAQLVKSLAERPALAGVAAGIARRSPWLIDRLARLTRIDDPDH